MDATAFEIATITAGAKSPNLSKADLERVINRMDSLGVQMKLSTSEGKGFRNNVTLYLPMPRSSSPNLSCRLYFTGSIHMVGGKSLVDVRRAFEFLKKSCGIPVCQEQVYMITGSFRVSTEIDRYELTRYWTNHGYGEIGTIQFDPHRHPALKITFIGHPGVVMVYRTGVITITGRVTKMSEINTIREFMLSCITDMIKHSSTGS